MPDNTEEKIIALLESAIKSPKEVIELLEKLESRVHRLKHRVEDVDDRLVGYGTKINGIGRSIELLHSRLNNIEKLLTPTVLHTKPEK